MSWIQLSGSLSALPHPAAQVVARRIEHNGFSRGTKKQAEKSPGCSTVVGSYRLRLLKTRQAISCDRQTSILTVWGGKLVLAAGPARKVHESETALHPINGTNTVDAAACQKKR